MIPKLVKRRIDDKIVVPQGTVEKAQLALKLLKDAIRSLASENPQGITNSDFAHFLGLRSDNEGKQQDYPIYSVLGLLLKESVLESKKVGNKTIYKNDKDNTLKLEQSRKLR